MFRTELLVETTGRGSYEITDRVNAAVGDTAAATGMCHLFIRHTSASLMLCENADPAVHRDLETFMGDLVPDGDERFTHTAEGPDDMPAHIRSTLTQTQLSIPVRKNRLALGIWQGIYLFEHRIYSHKRNVLLHLLGE